MRSKQEYVLQTNDRGKQEPKKIGLAPVQRDGMEYEFTIFLDVDISHNASSSKDRTGLYDGKIFKVSTDTGKELIDWLDSGADIKKEMPTPEAPESKPSVDLVTVAQQKGLYVRLDAIAKDFEVAGCNEAAKKSYVYSAFKVSSTKDIPSSRCAKWMDWSKTEEGQKEIAGDLRARAMLVSDVETSDPTPEEGRQE
jgi:hypothetical protein